MFRTKFQRRRLRAVVTAPVVAAGVTPVGAPVSWAAKPTWMTGWADFAPFTATRDDGSAGSGFTWARRTMTALTSANVSAFRHWWGIGTRAVPHLTNGSNNTAEQTSVAVSGGASTIPARSPVTYEVRS